MSPGFRAVEGGLFSTVTKADVGNVAAEMERQGIDMLSWADPFMPDPVIPTQIREAAIRSIATGNASHYTTPVGNSELKEIIAEKLQSKNGLTVDPHRNILITPGSDSGLLFAMMPFICPGDEVLVPEPSYPSNFLNPQLLGGTTVSIPLLETENSYVLDLVKIESLITPKTKMILLTNPNNPTSTVFSRTELEELAKLIVQNNLILVVDQAFEDSVFDDREMISMAALPGMFERTVSIFSISKGMALSGFRVGYLVASDQVMDVMYGSAVNVIGATSTAFQLAAVEAFRNDSFIQEYNEVFDIRRKRVYEMINSVSSVKMQMPQSAYLSWVDVSQLGTGKDISNLLKDKAKVFVNDGAAYGPSGINHIRIVHGCYQDDNRVYSAISRICQVLSEEARS
ncbi:MAG: pyridoxal phosphate-dependent aminotransferase [Saccharofermentanales bacterium]